ncbi:hypothetical protein [Dolosigranulum pigrum]|uniref:hypothetical protein n=1 Tax=Dolosigranulum pigrum TaxID=29394 RepID=UPI00163DC2B7|nr:hypothetical protein [Dolosigranulum pigrum]
MKAETIQTIDDAVKAKEMAIEEGDNNWRKSSIKVTLRHMQNEAKATIATE